MLKTFLYSLFEFFDDRVKKESPESRSDRSEQVALQIAEKMTFSERERNFDIAGTWIGSALFDPSDGPIVESEWIMKLKWEEGQLSGVVNVKGSTGTNYDLKMGNVRYQNGLLLFTLKDENSRFILDNILAVTSTEIKGIFRAYQGQGKIHLTRQF